MKRTKIIAVIMAAAVMCCVFAACKKDPSEELSTSESSSRSAWLDETVSSSEEVPPTAVVTDENGETKVVEYETDAQGEIATEADGQKVTKAPQANGTEDPANPVNGNTTTTTTKKNNNGNGNTTTTTRPHTTTTTTRPNTTTTTTQPAPPPVPAELTEADKEAMINDLMAYARQVGYPQVYRDDMGDNNSIEYADVTPQNYDKVMNHFKSLLSEFYTTGYRNEYVNIQWGKANPNRLFVYTE